MSAVKLSIKNVNYRMFIIFGEWNRAKIGIAKIIMIFFSDLSGWDEDFGFVLFSHFFDHVFNGLSLNSKYKKWFWYFQSFYNKRTNSCEKIVNFIKTFNYSKCIWIATNFHRSYNKAHFFNIFYKASICKLFNEYILYLLTALSISIILTKNIIHYPSKLRGLIENFECV
jgi:hypothetical protein